MSVAALYQKLSEFKKTYDSNKFPDLVTDIDVSLFNTYRYFAFPEYYPRSIQLHKDPRGVLFEAVKGGGGGQTFLSWTEPDIERGNHFHRNKIERFLVVSGQADIRIRALFTKNVHTFSVSGDEPQYVDIPTLHTHSIVNTGPEPLLTLFWAHEEFNNLSPDTYAHDVTAENSSD